MTYKDKYGRIVIPGYRYYPTNFEEIDGDPFEGEDIQIEDLWIVLEDIRDNAASVCVSRTDVEKIYNELLSRIITTKKDKEKLEVKNYQVCEICKKEKTNCKPSWDRGRDGIPQRLVWTCDDCKQNGTSNILIGMDNRNSNSDNPSNYVVHGREDCKSDIGYKEK